MARLYTELAVVDRPIKIFRNRAAAHKWLDTQPDADPNPKPGQNGERPGCFTKECVSDADYKSGDCCWSDANQVAEGHTIDECEEPDPA